VGRERVHFPGQSRTATEVAVAAAAAAAVVVVACDGELFMRTTKRTPGDREGGRRRRTL